MVQKAAPGPGDIAWPGDIARPGDIFCETPGGSIAVRGAGPVVPLLRHLAPAWPVHRAVGAGVGVAGADVAGVVTASFDGQVWRYQSTSYASPEYSFAPGLPAANGLVGALLGTMLGVNPDWMTLHAGGVEINGRLVLIIGANMAGKSTISTALAAAGCRLWSDDRVLLVPNGDDGHFQARALGLAAKVRLPLPNTAPHAYHHWVHDRRQLVGEDMVYLTHDVGETPPPGTGLVPAAVLVPDRSADGPDFALQALARGQAVKHLVPAAFAPALSPVARLKMLGQLAGGLQTMTLQYRDVFDILPQLKTMDLEPENG